MNNYQANQRQARDQTRPFIDDVHLVRDIAVHDVKGFCLGMLGAWTDVKPPQQTPLTAHIAIDITGATQAEKEFVWTKPFGVVWYTITVKKYGSATWSTCWTRTIFFRLSLKKLTQTHQQVFFNSATDSPILACDQYHVAVGIASLDLAD